MTGLLAKLIAMRVVAPYRAEAIVPDINAPVRPRKIRWVGSKSSVAVDWAAGVAGVGIAALGLAFCFDRALEESDIVNRKV